MNRSLACIFPDTVFSEKKIIPLVQCFSQLVYHQPIRNQAQLGSAPLQALVEEQRLLLHNPAPLGEKREQFIALMNDINTHGNSFISQLKALSLAAMYSDESFSRGQESGQDIISQLIAPYTRAAGIDKLTSKAQREKEERQWQARLVLKLGEFFDQQQAAVDTELQGILKKESSLFAALCDDGRPAQEQHEVKEMFSHLQASSSEQPGVNAALLQYRLQAWARLFCMDDHPLASNAILITESPEAMDSLENIYTQAYNVSPYPLGTIPLPGTAFEDAAGRKEYQTVVQKYIQTALTEMPCLQENRNIFAQAQEPETAERKSNEYYMLLKELITDIDRTDQPKASLTLSAFPNTSNHTLLNRAFAKLSASYEREPDKDETVILGSYSAPAYL